jgi:hypothetical protein
VAMNVKFLLNLQKEDQFIVGNVSENIENLVLVAVALVETEEETEEEIEAVVEEEIEAVALVETEEDINPYFFYFFFIFKLFNKIYKRILIYYCVIGGFYNEF